MNITPTLSKISKEEIYDLLRARYRKTYDEAKQEILDLEKKYKYLKDQNSPSKKIGFEPSSKFAKVAHKIPMLSLSNAFSIENVSDFIKKIQNGVDTRSYKVLFDKIEETLPGFKCNWAVEKGIKNLLDELKKIGLTKDTFSKREFYRLQQIEFLHRSQKINDDLFWINYDWL